MEAKSDFGAEIYQILTIFRAQKHTGFTLPCLDASNKITKAFTTMQNQSNNTRDFADDSAAADFTTILKTMDSLNVKAWYSRGIAWNKMNMPDRAIADYNTAIRINPGFQGPRVNRGNISFMRNQFDAAIADYNVALQLDPADGATFLNRSFSYFKLGRYTEALRDAMKAKELKTAVNPNYINDLEKGARR